ncbi:MAG: NADH-quinone oxidoreductase subunit NuoF [Myxococcota bacterium]|nr:NADH-quinone oxidoreductase subunit NuoF [Myxococcota bacterium]
MENPVRAAHAALVAAASARRASREAGTTVRIQVGSATCENAAGAEAVLDEFLKHIRATGRTDIRIHRVGCTGRCSREPIVGVLRPGELPVKYEQVDRDRAHRIFTEHLLGGTPCHDLLLDHRPASATTPLPRTAAPLPQLELVFCAAPRCQEGIGPQLRDRCVQLLGEAGIPESRVRVAEASCYGLCAEEEVGRGVHLLIRPAHRVYRITSAAELEEVFRAEVLAGVALPRLAVDERPVGEGFVELYGDVAFFNRQSRVALRNSGVLDPESLDEYLLDGEGFVALAEVLAHQDPEAVIRTLAAAKLRGRGGGGYPTGQKWADARRQPGTPKYILCNADEGDPGAFMDRSMLEGDPFSVIEGMILGGYAIGAARGFFYVRAEYPLAIRRIDGALRAARDAGLLGPDILGSGFSFDLEIRLGAGAFVCGEETALIHSIEGQRGQPRVRPPYPTESGLWSQPTVINNVETFANVPVVLRHGAAWFARLGTPKSGGTKVFALAGKVRHTGLVEVPMGTTLREVVMEIGGGVPGGRALKAIQTGGPAGGCIPAAYLDTPVDFDSLLQLGSIMGSGGMIVLDEDDCLVDIARYFMAFSRDESCGKCTPCREGTTRMLEILERIVAGEARPDDLERLERLAWLVKKSSLCGLGRAAPNPVLSTLKYFRAECEAHVHEKRCPARRCKALLTYTVIPDRCVGCTACARNCPVHCISGRPKQPHVIDPAACIRCGRCVEVCRFDAIARG